MTGVGNLFAPLGRGIAQLREPSDHGDAVRLLGRLGRDYAASIRLITLVPTAVVAVLAAWGSALVPAVVAALSAMAVWSVLFARWVRGGRRVAVAVADTAVLAAFALSTPLIVPAHWLMTGKSWLLPFVSFASVAMQYYAGLAAGGLCTLALSAAMVGGTLAGLPPGGSTAGVVTSVWVVVLSLLARILWTLVTRGGRKADQMAAAADEARRNRAVAEAVRADERALANALHDTAASTLLMVGLGQVHHGSASLARSARHDIEVLNAHDRQGADRIDAAQLLDDVLATIPLTVERAGLEQVWVPARAAHATVDAAREALNNVVKHAHVDVVSVKLDGGDHCLRIVITDHGTGFDEGAVRDTARGVRDSVHGRMESIGGRSSIDTGDGRGTVVTLEWTDG